jgi:hypothetical protein
MFPLIKNAQSKEPVLPYNQNARRKQLNFKCRKHFGKERTTLNWHKNITTDVKKRNNVSANKITRCKFSLLVLEVSDHFH